MPPPPWRAPHALLSRHPPKCILSQALNACCAEDRPELRRRQLKEIQFLISCTIQDLQYPTASSTLPPQLAANPQLLCGLQADLGFVNDQLEQLERDQLVPASPTADERQG